ncbi:MAG TPA: class II aldolase/adducin family protein [Candidatus Acidoferrales bacterium]|nr:class II aldolase/adducin family protein [Candidatus Acidoferrales bacterium]
MDANLRAITPGMEKSEQEHRSELCRAGAWLYQRGFVVATDGNLSLRLDADRVLTSPTGVSKGMLEPADLVMTDCEGRQLGGSRAPSSELPMHLAVYRRRPDVRAICHAHPPVATGYAAAGMTLEKPLLAECVLDLDCIPVAPYATPGTRELADALAPLVDHYNAVLLANHGVVTFGPDLLSAFFRMETTEHIARVTLVTELLGRQVLLTNRDVERLLASRNRPAESASESRGRAGESDRAGSSEVSRSRRGLEVLLAEALRNLNDDR